MENYEILAEGNKCLKNSPVFFRFLKENQIYDKWIENRAKFIKHVLLAKYPWRGTICHTYFPQKALLTKYQTSFVWNETPEGFTYWDNINTRYLKFLTENPIDTV
jgi:hypothetical protein